MTRLDCLTKLHALTSSNTKQDVFALLMDYIVDNGDPDMVLGINSVLGRVSASAAAITVPAATLAKAQTGQGTYASLPSSTL